MVVFTPGTDELHLLQRFRRVEVIAALGNASPPGRQLTQGPFTGHPISDEVATHSCTCPSDSSPAMQVDFVPFLQLLVDRIQNGIHLFWTRQPKISNWKAQVSC